MKSACLADLIRISKVTDGPFSKAVRESTEVGVVVPSILETKLKANGLSINHQAGADHGNWVLVTTTKTEAYEPKDKGIVARAFSHDRGDALLQAVYAEMKQEELILIFAAKVAKQNPAAIVAAASAANLTEQQRMLLQTLRECHEDKTRLDHAARHGIDGDAKFKAFLNQL